VARTGLPAVRWIDRSHGPAYIARMAIREIIVLPDKQLRLVSKPIEKVSSDIRRFYSDSPAARTKGER
jgi:hypothetical protein